MFTPGSDKYYPLFNPAHAENHSSRFMFLHPVLVWATALVAPTVFQAMLSVNV